jgi:hypothetical protein
MKRIFNLRKIIRRPPSNIIKQPEVSIANEGALSQLGKVHELLPCEDIMSAWNWLLSIIQARPTNPGTICYFDEKCWNDDPSRADYQEIYPHTCLMLGRLYVTSQFGDYRNIIDMVHGKTVQAVVWSGENLDRDSKSVISDERRFRNHLSEHLAFWIRLAIEKKQQGLTSPPTDNNYTYSKPHIQPEDKGPDGLYVEVFPTQKVEIQSVKSSINDPQSQISTSEFRNTGNPCSRDQKGKPLLDEFWWHVNFDDGLIRLDHLLDDCLNTLDTSSSQLVRIGLIKSGALNAVVVANAQYSDESIFAGYHNINPDISKRIATFIGSMNWELLARDTRGVVTKIISDCGVNVL